MNNKLFFSLKFLFFVLILNTVNGGHYEIRLNSDLTSRGTFIQSNSKKFKYECLAECNKLTDCNLSVYDRSKSTSEINCFLYASYFDSNKLIKSDLVDIYIRKDGIATPRLIELFKNYQNSSLRQQKYVASSSIRNFDTYIKNSKMYYLIARSNLILAYDEDWNYNATYSLSNQIYYIKILDYTDIYISASTKTIQKLDAALNILAETVTASINGYRELFYYKKTDQIYGSNVGNLKIDIFDRNLNFLDAINTGRYNHAIFIFNDILYMGTNIGFLVAYQYQTFLYEVQTRCSTNIFSLTMDFNGHISLACDNLGFFLYDKNGTYLNYNISLVNTRYLNFDNKQQGIFMDSMNLNIIRNLF